jgi:hypothetical protein
MKTGATGKPQQVGLTRGVDWGAQPQPCMCPCCRLDRVLESCLPACLPQRVTAHFLAVTRVNTPGPAAA